VDREEEEEEEEEFFNHYKNDLERHAHTPSGVAGADLKSQSRRDPGEGKRCMAERRRGRRFIRIEDGATPRRQENGVGGRAVVTNLQEVRLETPRSGLAAIQETDVHGSVLREARLSSGSRKKIYVNRSRESISPVLHPASRSLIVLGVLYGVWNGRVSNDGHPPQKPLVRG